MRIINQKNNFSIVFSYQKIETVQRYISVIIHFLYDFIYI